MLAIEKDIVKLCDEAIASGRSAFTFAGCLRINLAYHTKAGWAVVATVIDNAASKMLGDISVSIAMLCNMIEKRLGSGLRFSKPKIAPTPPDLGLTYIVESTAGPGPSTTTDVDQEACSRVVRYAKRDGRGTVTTNGWRLHLHQVDNRWLLEVADEIKLESREDLSRRHYQLGQLSETISHLLRSPVDVQKTSVG